MALNAGNIAFVGFNADGNDNLAFVALVNIPAGETIYFEDNEWNGSSFADTNEGAFSWTSTAAVAAGTIVRIDNIGTGTISASTGTVVASVTGRGGNRGIAAGDEVIYAYQGTPGTPTVFLTAIANGGFSAANGVLTGTGLTAGTNAIDLSSVDDDADIGAYNASRSGQTSFASYLSLINNPNNWVTQDGTGDQSADGTPPDVPFSATGFTVTAGTPNIQITEYMYNPTTAAVSGEFVEFTNLGTSAVDFTGWSFDDNSRTPGSFSLSAFGIVQPGESVILTESDATAFRTAWNLPSTVKVIGGLNQNLGRADEINLYDASNNLVDRLTYDDQTFAGTIRTQGASGWTEIANLNDTTIDADWKLSVVNDAQNSQTSTGGDIGNPGIYNFSPGVNIFQSGGSTNIAEGGATDSYKVVLKTQPTANVTISINPGSQTTTNPATLSFTTANWNVPQTVTVTAVDDAVGEGNHTGNISYLATSSDSNYNGITIANVIANITDNDGGNTAPTIQADNETVIDPEKVTAFLSIPNNSPTGSPAAFVSGVINDPTDPARTIGIEFNVADAETAAGSLTVTATSSNTAVVANGNLGITGTGNSRNLKITPTGVGFADITVTVSDGTLSNSYVIKYAASAAGNTNSRFLTGTSDASTAIAIDSNYIFVADDEDQTIRLYDRNNSGLPINSFDFTASLGLSGSSEVDIEASTRIGNTIYWLGSHSNNSSNEDRPNRERIFATQISGTGANTTLTFQGYYKFLEDDLIAWDNANGQVLGLAASAANGVSPEVANGFNIEGLTIAPDGTTAYVAFRAPNEPTTNRTKALIVPVTNFTSILNNSGGTTGSATFGSPIQLDLGGRGIRSIERNASNQYIIIAGPAGAATGTAPNDFRLYTWTGNSADAPVLRAADLTALNAGGSFESIVEVPNSLTSGTQIQVLVDNGDTVWYNDSTISKDLAQNNFQKFRSETITLGNEVTAPTITKIHDIQGSGSTFNTGFGGTRTIEGIVVSAFLGSTKLNGFYVQEEDADADTNFSTSEAIFVFDSSGQFTGVAGDKVRVTGTVAEFTSTSSGVTSSLTQLSSVTSVVNLGASTLPTITNIQLPVTSVADLERYEGMLVNVSGGTGNLTVTEYFELGRFGQVVLAANGASNQPGTDGRLDQYTQFNAPSVSGNSAYLAEIAKRQIILDDGRNTQNPDPIIFARGGNPLSASNTLRGGDTVASITGVLDERFEGYRIQTSTGVNFTPANPRPTTVPDVGGTLKVASFNVLNYFNGNGTGGGFPTSRGAENLNEFNRQRDKTIAAIIGLNADVVGLIELENDGYGATSAIQDLVNGLNAVAGAGTYAFINPGTSLATDEITVGLIYKPGKVTPVGAAAAIPNGYGSGSFDLVGRKPLAQTFQQISTGESFTAVVNHFKSKGSSSGGVGDADAGDGQGLSNGTRTRQAQDLAQWLATNPTNTTDPDYLILGDLNAYAKEDPLTTLQNAGYNNLLPNTSYSYVFDGQVGSLDHALGTSSLASQVTGAEKWHINADEPTVLDYNTNFKSAGQQTSLYNADAFRSSDHDPVVVGLDLYSINVIAPPAGSRNPITGTAGNDRIFGGAGAKTITTGAGRDEIVYTNINEVGHRITDFEVGKDKIVLTQLLDSLVSGGYNGTNAITDGYVKLVQGSTASASILQIDNDGLVGSAIFRNFLVLDNVSQQLANNTQNFVF
ncbi:ExeM/NucH family extracellular endonuclease [Calothrix sp. PCC 7507]|uniref:ExeM/NucH family extracellular endonuclease n=1 Tax=Calothrix sp. PCC 7507 TaxID=99598 RepID=UPI00029EF7CF|nr:ExeM/NucH family extracellular endonuclease [Calothrix sp. PCC 7507]AFY32951.1 type 1 secretion target domain protein [Calothrix sp. PCC 7507]